MKKALIGSIILVCILVGTQNQLFAQTSFDTDGICMVKYVPQSKVLKHNALPKNKEEFCDRLIKMFLRYDNLSYQNDSLDILYSIDITFSISESGNFQDSKVTFCSEILRDFSDKEVLPFLRQITWEPAYFNNGKKNTIKRKLVASKGKLSFYLKKRDSLSIHLIGENNMDSILCGN